ncbi:hypothetical protein FHS51_002957 [Sphingobium wenxiniae]|uniref:Uncharacterized protein n=3 Tax=Sphingomonadaceae TaxID=41297 RepID=A0A841JB59_9SPHN|nr:hypothetical protein [Sphingobium wenxiniae]MBB6125818.1 hypothetical protein [Sphingobium subterraneum]SCW93730.1 hypothetical protein SAMN02927924_04378 [Sphingobium faniae]GEO01886.1 hypothetical protein NSE01_37180 [Novosphingobium sediminis]MBB6192704.1 hypothetical protein [Sphingobium wenxiniae]TWH92157.1 hypothetical protein IQ35_02680 [Sphingobium wenxiniae]
MSRYSLRPLPERSDIFEVAVGWDLGLGTFFVMVFGVAEVGRDPDVRHWRGGQPRQIVTVEELQTEVSPYAELPMELVSRLRGDQSNGGASPPQRLSRLISGLLGNGCV